MAKVKSFFVNAGLWIKNHFPTRRRIIQLYAALLTNANLKNYSLGVINQGNTKVICTPGINCYSCPGAVTACPLGSLQNSLGASKVTTPYYIIGIIALYGLLLARTICGFLCPFGFFQDMLYKIKTPKVKKSAATRVLSYLKYLFLIVLVIAIPLMFKSVPGFCKYICPAGTIGGAGGLLPNTNEFYSDLGALFSWKFALLIVCVVVCVFIYRAFCRFICPLGAIYGFFNKISLLGVKLDKSQCIECGACIAQCKMDIKHVGDHECINCGECIKVCPTKAISWKGSKIFVKLTSSKVTANGAEEEELKPLNVYVQNGTTLNAGRTYVNDSSAAAPAACAVSAEQAVTGANGAQDGDGTAKEPAGRECDVAEQPAKKKNKALAFLKKKFKNPAFVTELVAWILATAFLIGTLVYFNTRPLPVPPEKLEEFSCQTYNTAYEGEEYTLETNTGKPTIAVFWDSKSSAAVNYVNEFAGMYDSLKDRANIVIVSIFNGIPEASIQEVIDSNGWNELPIPFIQDTQEMKLLSKCEGGNAQLFTAFLSYHLELYAKHSEAMTLDGIQAELDKAFDNSDVFVVGDKLPEVTVQAYQSAYKEPNFSFSSARGKVLVINFWYVSCGGCVAELPDFNAVQSANKDNVEIVAIHSNNGEKPQPYIDSSQWGDWGVIFGQDYGKDVIFHKFGGTSAYPITIIVNPDGVITCVNLASMSRAKLESEIQKALNG